MFGPRELVFERHKSLPVALDDILNVYLILDWDQTIHDVGVIKLLIYLVFVCRLYESIFEKFQPFSHFFEHFEGFWFKLITNTRIVGLKVFNCNFLGVFSPLQISFAPENGLQSSIDSSENGRSVDVFFSIMSFELRESSFRIGRNHFILMFEVWLLLDKYYKLSSNKRLFIIGQVYDQFSFN